MHGGRPPAWRDPVACALLAAGALGALQAAAGVLAPTAALAGAAPYLLGAAAAVVGRATGPGPDRPAAADRWLRVLTLAGVALAAWALSAAAVAAVGRIGQPHAFYEIKAAVVTPLGAHNTAAGLLLAPAAAAAALAGRDRRWHAALAVIALGLVATLSRGAAAVLLAVGLAGWAVGRAVGRRLAAAGAGALAAVVALSALLDASPPGGGPSAGPLGASVLGRLDLAVRGAEAGVAHPWLGVGLGRFAQVAGDLPPPNDHAHQLLANALAEGGVGLLVVAAAVPLLLAWRVWRLPAGPWRDALALGGLALVAHAQVEILGGRPGYEVTVALLAGLAAGRAGAPAQEVASRRRSAS